MSIIYYVNNLRLTNVANGSCTLERILNSPRGKTHCAFRYIEQFRYIAAHLCHFMQFDSLAFYTDVYILKMFTGDFMSHTCRCIMMSDDVF